MAYLVDTNILCYWLQPTHPRRQEVMDAVKRLIDAGEALQLVPQNVVELWNFVTRPTNSGSPGLGRTIEAADTEVRYLTGLFPVLPDVPVVYDEWRRLIVVCRCVGRQVFDARIAAAMRMHAISHILTFNVKDFVRYPGITAVEPKDV